MGLTLKEIDDLLASFDWPTWSSEMAAIVGPSFKRIAIDQGKAEAEAIGGTFSAVDPFLTRYFTRYLGERITQLSDTTRDLITDELHRAFEDGKGESQTELASRLGSAVGDSAAFSPARSLMIARTETAIAYNSGAIASFKQNGISNVEVSDGDGDDECEEADGEIWTLDDALDNPIAHPNCVRSFAPADEGDEE